MTNVERFAVRKLAVHESRIHVLALVHACESISQRTIARFLGLSDRVAWTRMRDLHADGLVHRWRQHTTGTSFATHFRYTLTPRGRAVLVDRAALLLEQSRRAA